VKSAIKCFRDVCFKRTTIISKRWSRIVDSDHPVYCSFYILSRSKFIGHVMAKQLQATPSSSRDRCVAAYCPLLCIHICIRHVDVHYYRTNPAKISALWPNSTHKKAHPQIPCPKLQKVDCWPVPPSSRTSSGMHAISKMILTRVGFEPTPFRTSVLEEP
jgi:hypothetical protein